MIQNELFYQKRHQPGIKENITTGHLKITLGGSQISIGRKQAKKAAESPRKGYALLFFQMCPKRIIKKEGSPKVRSPEPWGTMELPPGSRNRPTQGIPHALGREPSRLSNKISELICPMMATWLPFFLLPNGRLYPLSVWTGNFLVSGCPDQEEPNPDPRKRLKVTIRPRNSYLIP